MSPYASRQRTRKMTNRPHFAHIHPASESPFALPEHQEDVNGEKLTVKKWWIFGADFFTV